MKFSYLVILFSLLLVSCSSDTTAAEDLEVGDCFEKPDEGEFRQILLTDCELPHTAQLFAQFTSEFDEYENLKSASLNVDPSTKLVINNSELKCNELLAEVALKNQDVPEDFTLFVLYPSEDAWNSGDKSVQCVLTTDKPWEGSIV